MYKRAEDVAEFVSIELHMNCLDMIKIVFHKNYEMSSFVLQFFLDIQAWQTESAACCTHRSDNHELFRGLRVDLRMGTAASLRRAPLVVE